MVGSTAEEEPLIGCILVVNRTDAGYLLAALQQGMGSTDAGDQRKAWPVDGSRE